MIKTNFIMMDMPRSIKIALPIGDDNLIDSQILLLMRDQAWAIIQDPEYFFDIVGEE
jgi:hypothetical protein